jgi:hypothetical protein
VCVCVCVVCVCVMWCVYVHVHRYVLCVFIYVNRIIIIRTHARTHTRTHTHTSTSYTHTCTRADMAVSLNKDFKANKTGWQTLGGNILKILSLVTFYCKCTRALTLENFTFFMFFHFSRHGIARIRWASRHGILVSLLQRKGRLSHHHTPCHIIKR